METQKSAPETRWEKPYAQLRARLGRIGWISEGYVQDRGPGAGGPCYQWTRKVKRKTVSVALSREQFEWLRQAIGEWARVLAPRARVALVVDNVRFEGELLPVDLVLSEMAEEFGFRVEEIVVARYKGNSSQQMGKYGRVPVRESIAIWTKQ